MPALKHCWSRANSPCRLRNNASSLLVFRIRNPHSNRILAVLPVQLLPYRTSVIRGYDPDFPRNLSKTLTVD